MKRFLFFLIAIVFTITGCSSNKAMQESYYSSMLQNQSLAYQAQVEQGKKSLCAIECPEDGCKIKSMSCNAPQNIKIPQVQAPVSDAKYYADALVRGLSIAAPVYLGVQGFKSMESLATGIADSVSGPTNTYNNSYNQGTMFGDGVNGAGQVGDNAGNNYGSGQLGDTIGNNFGDGQLGDTIPTDNSNQNNVNYPPPAP